MPDENYAAPVFDAPRAVWDDLPMNLADGLNSAKWARSRGWGTRAFGRFVRTEGYPASVNQRTHATLREALEYTAATWVHVYDEIAARMPFQPVTEGRNATGTVVVPRSLKTELTNRMRSLVSGAGPVVDHVVMNAAMRAVDEAKIDAVWGRAPVLPWDRSKPIPAGISVRLPCGLAHGASISAAGYAVNLGVPGVDPMILEWGPPRNVHRAAYAELAQWDQRWRIRFVYQDEQPDLTGPTSKHGMIPGAKAIEMLRGRA